MCLWVKEDLTLGGGSGKEGHGVGQHLLASSGLRKQKRNKQGRGKRYPLAVECAIRLGMLMQENLSTQSYYHTFFLTNLTQLATFPMWLQLF